MSALAAFSGALSDGRIEIIDLTHTLAPDFPVIVLPPEFGACQPVRIEEVSRYDARGPAWYWNTITVSEHAGTHFDAPAHWITGRSIPNGTVDALPPRNLAAPAIVIDVTEHCANNPDFVFQRAHCLAHEEKHGRIPAGCWVLLRTDWSKKAGTADYVGLRADGAHSPGPDASAMRFLVEERDILGFGVETVGTDHGQGGHFDPPYPAHSILHGAGKYGLQCLKDLDRLPPSGSVLVAAPLKILEGSGSPLRVIAFVEKAA
jgi:kynurenine formamidase